MWFTSAWTIGWLGLRARFGTSVLGVRTTGVCLLGEEPHTRMCPVCGKTHGSLYVVYCVLRVSRDQKCVGIEWARGSVEATLWPLLTRRLALILD